MTPKQIDAKIKKANAIYKRSTAAQRRVLIAKDALKQIAARKMIASCGIWTDVRVAGSDVLDDAGEPLQPILHRPDTKCHCCGVGAIFIGYVRLNNNAMVMDGWYYEDIRRVTGWPSDNLRQIEIAFEKGCGRHAEIHNAKDRKARGFGLRYEESEDRLVAILKNIVRNKGLFQP